MHLSVPFPYPQLIYFKSKDTKEKKIKTFSKGWVINIYFKKETLKSVTRFHTFSYIFFHFLIIIYFYIEVFESGRLKI